MMAAQVGSLNLWTLALLVVSLAHAHGQVSTDSQKSAESDLLKPLEPLEVPKSLSSSSLSSSTSSSSASASSLISSGASVPIETTTTIVLPTSIPVNDKENSFDNEASSPSREQPTGNFDVDNEEDNEHGDGDDYDSDEHRNHHRYQESFKFPVRHHELNVEAPIEHVDETYIDTSDPSDPKKVHYSKEVKAHVGPNGESYQHNESKTANSIGANPNSHSYHHSSSSSSYVSSHSDSAGGNYKHYEPYGPHRGEVSEKYNNRVNQNHVKPYHHIQSQHHHNHIPPLPSPPPIGPWPPFRMPPMPQMPAWLDLAQPSYRLAPAGSFPEARLGGRVLHGPDDIKHLRSQLGSRRNGEIKRRLSKLQAKRLERLERGPYSDLEDFL